MTKKEKLREYKRRWWLKNRDRILPEKRIKRKIRYRLNREKELKCSREWQKKHPDRVSETKARWRKSNPEKSKQAQRDFWRRNRDNPSYRLRRNLTVAISKAISQRGKKCARTVEFLGCSLDSFRMYLESRFEPGMTWENYGRVWHIDHIVPSSIFDLSKTSHQKRCFHFSNLQPLFARDNAAKKDRAPDSHQFGML